MKNWVLILIISGCFAACKTPHLADASGKDTHSQTMEETMITVEGEALNAKEGAMVKHYYIEGLSSWPADVYGKIVEVTGKLKLVEHKEEDLRSANGEWSQGMVGTQHILVDAKYKLVE